MTLRELEIGKQAVVKTVGGEGALRQHFLDMGVIPGANVKVVKFAPMGDPMELRLHGYELTLRLADAEHIEVVPAQMQGEITGDDKEEEPKQKEKQEGQEEQAQGKEETKAAVRKKQDGQGAGAGITKKNIRKNDKKKKREHPGFGEEGKYHSKENENPLPEDTVLTYALVGNQNCGKTTLFNQLTGSNQHVGNFPGVTVDRKDGMIKGRTNTLVTDLPGIYSMSPYSSEELVSRDFVLQEKPKAIINIVDATNIERNLYLTMQLLEMDIPMVVALNMMDEMMGNGGYIDINGMEEMLGVPVIPISAAKNQGVDELVDHAIHIAHFQEKPLRQDFCDENDFGGAVHRCLHAVIHLIEDHAAAAGIPVRFAASKLIEGDSLILEQLQLDKNEIKILEHIVLQMENERGLDRSAAIADMRFLFIRKICEENVVKPKESREHKRSEKIDRILTGKYTAIPAFILIMASVFYLTFNVIGAWLQQLMEKGVQSLTKMTDSGLKLLHVNKSVTGLIIDGIFAGVGSVVSFLPIIVTLFFFLSLLEDSGYIARVAFFMDKLLRKIGLSGKSIVPLLIGFGCTVPAVMATRTLPSERDRKMTILLTPFMSCTAKLPIYAFFVNAFFKEYQALMMTGLYFLGIIVGILVAFVYKEVLFKGEPVPFVMELPNYRLPGAKNVGQLLWEKAKDFIQRAFSVILLATIGVWFLQSFDFHFNLVTDSSKSIMALMASFLAPLLKPVGLGDWRIVTSLISGFMAKESVVSTMKILFGENITGMLTHVQAAALLAFSLLYTPCVAVIASVKRELGKKWAFAIVVWQCMVAWLVALAVRGIWVLLH